ncbi:MAG: cbb3-type cytochrome c oxidase N-terminal domain-containing protein [Bacteroidota bacterium]
MKRITNISIALGAWMMLGLSHLRAEDIPMGEVTFEDLTTLLLGSMIVLAIAILALVFLVLTLIRYQVGLEKTPATEPATEEVSAETVEPKLTIWDYDWWKQKMTDAVPIAQEASIDMGHDYDGIRELDNNLPPWWKYGFYLTIVISVVYIYVYHIQSDWSSAGEYEAEMAEAAEIKARYLERVANMVNENSATVLTAQADLAEGKSIYEVNCVPCHGTQGEGGIGPNFADAYWIHGGDVKDLFKTIKYGVPEKGMIAWQDQLKPKEIQQLASYILEFQGTNPAGAKGPEGELYVPPVDSLQVDTTQVALNVES